MSEEVNTDIFETTKDVMGGKFEELISRFLSNSDSYIHTIQNGLENSNFKAVKDAAHPLKSSSAMIGFMGMSEHAKLIEACAKKDDISQDDIDTMQASFVSLMQSYEGVKLYIDYVLISADDTDQLNDENIPNIKKLKVLHIDDDVVVCKVTKGFLDRNGAYHVQSYADLKQAISNISSFLPDVILLDYNLKDVSGEESVDFLRSYTKTKDVPVILVTGVDEKNIDQGVLQNVSGYLHKPYRAENLINKIQAVVS